MVIISKGTAMGRKKEHQAIISCDPSFKGCAFVLWHKAADNFSKAQVYDIRCQLKKYDAFLTQVELVNNLIENLLEDFAPHIYDCTAMIIEGQYKPKMLCLCHAIVNQLYVILPKCRDFYCVSAKFWRPFFKGLNPSKSTYAQRKKASVEYVRRNPQLICSELWVKDDNVCEAILLLNYLVDKKSLSIATTMPIRLWLGDTHKDFTDKEINLVCPDCKNNSKASIRITATGNQKGTPYLHCKECLKSTGKGYKKPITNNKWCSLIKEAQKEAKYLIDDDTEEMTVLTQKPAAKKKVTKPSRVHSDDDDDDVLPLPTLDEMMRLIRKQNSLLAVLQGRVDMMEKVVLSLTNPVVQESPATKTPKLSGQKRATMPELQEIKQTKRFSQQEKSNALFNHRTSSLTREENGDPDADGTYYLSADESDDNE